MKCITSCIKGGDKFAIWYKYRFWTVCLTPDTNFQGCCLIEVIPCYLPGTIGTKTAVMVLICSTQLNETLTLLS